MNKNDLVVKLLTTLVCQADATKAVDAVLDNIAGSLGNGGSSPCRFRNFLGNAPGSDDQS